MGGKKRAAIVACLALLAGLLLFPSALGRAATGDVTVTADVPNASESGGPPGATNDPATNVTTTSATINATVNPGGVTATYHFVYSGGTTPDTTTDFLSAGFDSNDHEVSADISDLAPGTEYTFHVVIENSFGTTAATPPLTFTTDSLPQPTAVTDAATGVSTDSATLNGLVNPNGNGGVRAHFEWGDSPSGQTVTNDQDPGSGTGDVGVSETLTNLLPNTTYYFRIVVTGVGDSIPGDQLSFTTGASAPVVTTLNVDGISPSGATLHGSVNPNGSETTYHFQYGTDLLDQSTPDIAAGSGTSANDVSASITGLQPNTHYFYAIFASNGGGEVEGSELDFYTQAGQPTVHTGDASGVTTDAATLNGTVNPQGSGTTFSFEYGTDTSYGTTTDSGELGISTDDVNVSRDLEGLAAGTTYHFRIVATNGSGTVMGDDNTFTTPEPPSQTPIVSTNPATAVGAFSATLNGSINPNGSPAAYGFEYGTTASYGSSTSDTSAGSGTASNDVSATITGLTPLTTYHFRIRGHNPFGQSNGEDASFHDSRSTADREHVRHRRPHADIGDVAGVLQPERLRDDRLLRLRAQLSLTARPPPR